MTIDQINKGFMVSSSLLVAVIFFGMFFGQRALFWLLVLILAGQVVVNWRQLDQFMKEVLR